MTRTASPASKRCTPAAQSLVSANRGLAYSAARRYLNAGRTVGVSLEDLQGEALFALARAAAHYDPDRGTLFSTLAVLAICRHLCQTLTFARRRMGLSAALRQSRSACHDDEDSRPRTLVDLRALDPSRIAAARDELDRVRRMVQPRVWRMIELHLVQGLLFREIGERVGLTRTRVQQLVVRALRRLRRLLAVEGERRIDRARST
jgi:RNA polymerase sigma factor (sigma-70 family)